MNIDDISRTWLGPVQHCARCHGDHEAVTFSFFENWPIVDADGTVWQAWGLCPTTKEPILLKIEETTVLASGSREELPHD